MAPPTRPGSTSRSTPSAPATRPAPTCRSRCTPPAEAPAGRRAGRAPRGWANQKVVYDAKRHTHTAQGLSISTIHGDLLWCDGGWPGSCHEHELLELSGVRDVLEETGVVTLVNRGFRGMAKTREHWHAPVGDRRTTDQLTNGERDHNRLQAGLRALVEQTIGHLANAWALRRWRGLLYRVRDLYVAPEAAMGGAIGLVRDGDPITIDVTSRQVTLELPDAGAGRQARPVPAGIVRHGLGRLRQVCADRSVGEPWSGHHRGDLPRVAQTAAAQSALSADQ